MDSETRNNEADSKLLQSSQALAEVGPLIDESTEIIGLLQRHLDENHWVQKVSLLFRGAA